MYQILEDYKTIYQHEAYGKTQRKKRHQATVEWLNKEYTAIPDLQELMVFCKENGDIKLIKQFYDRLFFPQIRSGDKYDADALLMVFQNEMDFKYREYLLWEVSVSELENIVLEKYPNDKSILEYRYERLMRGFDYFFNHEVPNLCHDDASIEELHEMKSNLEEFRETCSILNIDNDEYIRRISDMYNAYGQYIINNNYMSFQEYLEENHIEY